MNFLFKLANSAENAAFCAKRARGARNHRDRGKLRKDARYWRNRYNDLKSGEIYS